MGGIADRARTITIRWRTQGPSDALGPALESLYPIDETPCFDEVLDAIDKAERQVWDDGDPEPEEGD